LLFHRQHRTAHEAHIHPYRYWQALRKPSYFNGIFAAVLLVLWIFGTKRNITPAPSIHDDVASGEFSSFKEANKTFHSDLPSASYTRTGEGSFRIRLHLWPISRGRPGYIRVITDFKKGESPKQVLEATSKSGRDYRKSLKLSFRTDEEYWHGADLELSDRQAPLMFIVNERLYCASTPSCGTDYYLLVDPGLAEGNSQGTFGRFKVIE